MTQKLWVGVAQAVGYLEVSGFWITLVKPVFSPTPVLGLPEGPCHLAVLHTKREVREEVRVGHPEFARRLAWGSCRVHGDTGNPSMLSFSSVLAALAPEHPHWQPRPQIPESHTPRACRISLAPTSKQAGMLISDHPSWPALQLFL